MNEKNENTSAISRAALEKAEEVNASVTETMSGLSEALILAAIANGITKEHMLEGVAGCFDIIDKHIGEMARILGVVQTMRPPISTAEH